jgi:ferredoxin
MKISVDRERCCGAGTCVTLAPDVFDQGEDDGIVVLLDESPSERWHDPVRKAAEVCPASAIRSTP